MGLPCGAPPKCSEDGCPPQLPPAGQRKKQAVVPIFWLASGGSCCSQLLQAVTSLWASAPLRQVGVATPCLQGKTWRRPSAWLASYKQVRAAPFRWRKVLGFTLFLLGPLGSTLGAISLLPTLCHCRGSAQTTCHLTHRSPRSPVAPRSTRDTDGPLCDKVHLALTGPAPPSPHACPCASLCVLSQRAHELVVSKGFVPCEEA